jgi:DNA repair exonuclease SbcCD ATPase subunit
MKHLFLLLLVVPVLWQCTNGPSAKQLRAENDSLQSTTAAKDSQMNYLVQTLGDIEENLRTIKEKEKIISVQSKDNETAPTNSESINKDIHMIYDLMLQNKEKVQQLESRLKRSSADNKDFKKLIESLNDQLRAKTEEIIVLQEELQKKNVQIDELNYAVMDLSSRVDSIQKVSETTQSQLETTTTEANTAYYAIGTRKELKDKNIVTKDGFLFFGNSKILKDDFKKEYFTRIDIRDNKEIELFRTKATILTSHPSSSYKLTNSDDGNLVLKISDVASFWSISNYLVVEVQ